VLAEPAEPPERRRHQVVSARIGPEVVLVKQPEIVQLLLSVRVGHVRHRAGLEVHTSGVAAHSRGVTDDFQLR
jgi:hypothetical protein